MTAIKTSRKWGGAVVLPLTNIIPENTDFIVQEGEIDGEKCIIIREYKMDNKKIKLVEA